MQAAYLQFLAVVLVVAATACTRERSRAVDSEPAAVNADRNYRDMLDRMREKQTADQLIGAVEAGIERFQFDLARLPTNLTELVALGYVAKIEEPPAGFAYVYDPVHGNVSLTPVDPGTGIQLPPELTNENRATLIDVNLPPIK